MAKLNNHGVINMLTAEFLIPLIMLIPALILLHYISK
jgi:hypothetical protein